MVQTKLTPETFKVAIFYDISAQKSSNILYTAKTEATTLEKASCSLSVPNAN
jgi:hypothetical protein